MKIYKNGELVEHKITDDIFGMSNIIGRRVKADKIYFSFYFSMKKSSEINEIQSIDELEQFVRENNIFNM